MWFVVLIGAGMAVAGLPILLLVYLRLAQWHVDRRVKAELKDVRLRRTF